MPLSRMQYGRFGAGYSLELRLTPAMVQPSTTGSSDAVAAPAAHPSPDRAAEAQRVLDFVRGACPGATLMGEEPGRVVVALPR